MTPDAEDHIMKLENGVELEIVQFIDEDGNPVETLSEASHVICWNEEGEYETFTIIPCHAWN